MPHLVPALERALGAILSARHDDAGALAAFVRANDAATRMGMRLHAMHARTCAADALLRLGRRADSEAMRDAADQMALEIAGHIGDPTQRAIFLDAHLQRARAQ